MDNDIRFDFFYNQTDHHLVQEYFALRTQAFIDQWGLKNFSGGEDGHDKNSHILIVHKNGQCLGGARFVVRDAGSDSLLPMETDEFQMVNLLPQLKLSKNKYAEISRVALSPDLRNGEYSTEVYRQLLCVRAELLEVNYVFCVTTMKLARSARISCKRIGIDLKIQKDIEVPELATYENNKMFVSLMDLNKASQNAGEDLEISA